MSIDYQQPPTTLPIDFSIQNKLIEVNRFCTSNLKDNIPNNKFVLFCIYFISFLYNFSLWSPFKAFSFTTFPLSLSFIAFYYNLSTFTFHAKILSSPFFIHLHQALSGVALEPIAKNTFSFLA